MPPSKVGQHESAKPLKDQSGYRSGAQARQLGNAKGERLLRERLVEEENTDKLLSDLAEATVNSAAEQKAA
jgi:ferritin-like metal-binding protein YciE